MKPAYVSYCQMAAHYSIEKKSISLVLFCVVPVIENLILHSLLTSNVLVWSAMKDFSKQF